MSFQQQIAKNFLTVGVLKYSGMLLAFVGSAFISRQISPAEYGIQVTGAIYYGIAQIFLDAGISMALIREADNVDFQRSMRLLSLGVSAGLAFLLLLASYPIAQWYGQPELLGVLALYAACLLLSGLPLVHEAVLSKREQFKRVASINLWASLLQIVLTYVLAVLGFSFWALIWPLLLVPLVKYFSFRRQLALPLDIHSLGRLPLRATYQQVRHLVANMTLFKVLVYAASNIDNLYLSKLQGSNSLALYNRAYTFNRLPVNIIGGVINTIQLPMFQRLKDEGKEVRGEFADYLQLLGALGFPAVVIFHLFGYELSAFIWGPNWREVGDFLYPLSIILPTAVMLNACGSMFILYQGERQLVYNSIISALAQIIGASVGILFSIKGMIIGLIIGNLLGSLPITMYLGFYRLFGYNFQQILRTWGFNYLLVVGLLLAYWLQNTPLQYAVLLVYSIGSVFLIIRYYLRHFTKRVIG